MEIRGLGERFIELMSIKDKSEVIVFPMNYEKTYPVQKKLVGLIAESIPSTIITEQRKTTQTISGSVIIATTVTTNTLNVTNLKDNSGNSLFMFKTINCPLGTDPVAGSLIDTLNLTSTDGSINVTGNNATDTVNFDIAPYTEVTGTSQSATLNGKYITNNAGLVTVTLPTTASVGSVISIVGKGAGGWRVAQNSGQSIKINTSTTTTGVTGYVQSTVQYNCIDIVCITANTTWVAKSSVGTLTIV